MKLRAAIVLAAIWVHSGCAFFGVERVECLTEDDCPENTQPGDGDGDWTGGASGDGDGDTGGTGGMPPGDGGNNSGGDGSGGAPSGGSGGTASGGTGGFEVAELARLLFINEIHGDYVEIYFRADLEMGDPETLSLDGFRIVVVGNDSDCFLDGAEVTTSSRFLLVQKASGACLFGAPNCVTGCTFTINLSSEIQLRKLIAGSYEVIDQRPHTDIALDGESSYQAIEDGRDPFHAATATPGYSNEL